MIRKLLVSLATLLTAGAGCERRPPPSTASGPPPASAVTPVRVLGVGIGDAESALAKVPNLAPIDDGMVADHTRGIEFGVEGGRVSYFLLRWDDRHLKFHDAKAPSHRPFSGPFEVDGRPVTFSSTTRESDVVAALGEPYWRDAERGEVLLFYEYEGVEVQVELTEGGPIRVLLVTDDPVLADPKSRKAYKVTKPWPPPKAKR